MENRFKVGDRVEDPEFGKGVVVGIGYDSYPKYPVKVYFEEEEDTFTFTEDGQYDIANPDRIRLKHLEPAPETTTQKLAKLWPMLTETPLRFHRLDEGSLAPTLSLSLTRVKYALIEHLENSNTEFSFDTVIEDRAIYLEVFHEDESKTDLDSLLDFAYTIHQFIYSTEKEA